ncbi:MAG: glycine--tRNA ligase subunit beta, partial [Actinomycetia bacterium]|nr:glycine--tRNA ligase subunit beta [Actinomycetes bacterium]
MSRDLLFEIGTEEIPSEPLYDAATQLRIDAERAFAQARLIHDEIIVYASPRRLAILVKGMADRQEDVTLRHKGPAVTAAFDQEGNPTHAAYGFARGKGVDVGDLVRETSDGGDYVWAVVEQPGRPAREVLPRILAGLAAGLQWPKAQRWGSGETRFIRPVRWLVALFGDEVLPVEFAGLVAGRSTVGHRFLGGPVDLSTASAYAEALRGVKVIADPNERAAILRRDIEAAAAARGGRAVVPEKTFAEVVNLVEWPTVASGRFDEGFLEVPREVLEEAMESHQRYFPVEGADGSLAPYFIVAHNGDPARTEAIVAGHERVIRARLADAAFFYAEDRKHSLEEYVHRLDGIIFQKR